MFAKRRISIACTLLTISLTTIAVAEEFSIDWYTIDGGGGYSAGGEFELDGTIGQPDAGAMIGDDFDLTGGFWMASQACTCPGDMNADGLKDGRDVQSFATCLISGGSCACADIDGFNGVDLNDADAFVTDLLSGSQCP